MSRSLVLLVDVPPPLADAVAAAFEEHEQSRLVPIGGAGSALTLAHGDPPELVVLGPALGWNEVIHVVEQLRGHASLVDTATLALVPAEATDFLEAAFAAGLGDAVPAPHPPALVRARVRALLAARRARLLLARQSGELKRLRDSQQGMTDHLATVISELMEAHEPGSSGRSQRMADLAMRVAARFEVPEPLVRDLWLAARLCDLGHLASPSGAEAGAHEAWSHAPLTAALLARFPGFEGASELVHSIGENWDGTGHPDRFLQGQIPLRSRILRVLHDFFAALEAGRSRGLDADGVLERMAERAGTLYDPMVLIELRAELEGLTGDRLHSDRRLVNIPELEPGMVLAEDLHADSGVKLLSRGTALTATTLEFLQRRHRVEPILHPAVVKQNAA